MITLDGSFGSGGGQILRTALALSARTGKAFALEKIRECHDRAREHIAHQADI